MSLYLYEVCLGSCALRALFLMVPQLQVSCSLGPFTSRTLHSKWPFAHKGLAPRGHCISRILIFVNISPLHVGISLRSVLKGTLSGSLSATLADESWKSPLIEDKKYSWYIRWRHIKKIVLLKCAYISGNLSMSEKLIWCNQSKCCLKSSPWF